MHAVAQAGNGLWYDGCEFGCSKTWAQGNNYCASIGMRLPALNQTTYSTSTGVPSCSSFTLTTTMALGGWGNNGYAHWLGNQWGYNVHYDSGCFRCVK